MALAQPALQTFDETICSPMVQAAPSNARHSDAPRVPLWFYGMLVLVVILWGISVVMFGVPGLYIPAVAFVPMVFSLLIWISIG